MRLSPSVARAVALLLQVAAVLLLGATFPAAAQTACGSIPTTYPLYGGSSTSIGAGGTVNGVKITGSGARSLNYTTGVIGNASQTLPALDPAVFPSNSSSTNTSATTIAAGDYKDVSVLSADATFTGGVYRIQKLTVDNNRKISLAPGTYYIEQLDMGNKAEILGTGSGAVRIMIKTGFSSGSNLKISRSDPSSFVGIFMYDGAAFLAGSVLSMSGLLYGPGSSVSVQIGAQASITGAVIVGGSVQIGAQAALDYSDTVRSIVGAMSSCQASAATVASFSVVPASTSASTCSPVQVTITALNASGSTLDTYVGTITMTTSTNRGDWALATAAGTLVNGTANDGAGTYTFAAADKGVVMLNLTNSQADNLTVSAASPEAKGASATLSFRDNAFVLTLDAVQVAGRPQSIGVAMWRRDPATGNCSIATGYTGTRALDAWITRDVQDPGGAAPTIGGVALPSTAPASNPASNNVSLSFSAGQATLALATTDVGKYALNLRDDTRSFAGGVDVSGTSGSITTRPFALGFTEIKQGAGTCSPASGTATCNPGGTATAGSKFVAAGDAFQATIGAYLWSAADDANNDGVPDAGAVVTDNGLAPSFAWATTLAAATPITPAAGVTGALGGTTSLLQAGYSGGRATASALTYAEVGSVTLQATATNYLGTTGANATGTSGVVGRFYPGRFAVLAGGSVTAACVAGGFTYMGQNALAVSVVVEAQTTGGARTFNYGTPGYAAGSVSWHGENANSGTDLAGRLSLPATAWSSGRYLLATTAAALGRAAAPDGPFDSLQLGVSVSDPDGAVLAGRNMNPSTAGDCAAAGNCTAVALGTPTRVRFGRLRIQSASGSELLPLAVPVEAQYWNGTGFTRHTSDVCTAIPAGAIGLGAYSQRSGSTLSPAPTSVAVPSGPLVAGTALLTLSAPGAGKGGDAELVANLGAGAAESLCGADTFTTSGGNLSWLRGRWCGSGHDRDPVGRVTFGVRRAATALVFLRENY